jgi:hypothetical protein
MKFIGYAPISAVLDDIRKDGIPTRNPATVRLGHRWPGPRRPYRRDERAISGQFRGRGRLHTPRPANESPDDSVRRIRELVALALELASGQIEKIRLVLEATPE